MSALEIEMASAAKFPYQKLRDDGGLFEFDDHNERDGLLVKSRSWFRFRFRRLHMRIRKRFRLKVPGMRRVVLRKRFRMVRAVRLSCSKVLKRLKESQAHFGDLFAGNYLFLQVNPTSMKSIHKSSQALPSTYSVPTLAN